MCFLVSYFMLTLNRFLLPMFLEEYIQFLMVLLERKELEDTYSNTNLYRTDNYLPRKLIFL